MIQVICMNGFPASGKTTFEDMCIDKLGESWAYKTSTVDFIKKLAKEMGWDGEKTPEARAFLSDLKDLASRAPWGDVPLLQIKKFCGRKDFELLQCGLADSATAYVFVDVREPENIKRLVEELGAITVLVTRDSADLSNLSNHADKGVLDYDYDVIIPNNGSLEDLKKIVDSFIIDLRKLKGKEMWRF